jgi:hypothetical protein
VWYAERLPIVACCSLLVVEHSDAVVHNWLDRQFDEKPIILACRYSVSLLRIVMAHGCKLEPQGLLVAIKHHNLPVVRKLLEEHCMDPNVQVSPKPLLPILD